MERVGGQGEGADGDRHHHLHDQQHRVGPDGHDQGGGAARDVRVPGMATTGAVTVMVAVVAVVVVRRALVVARHPAILAPREGWAYAPPAPLRRVSRRQLDGIFALRVKSAAPVRSIFVRARS